MAMLMRRLFEDAQDKFRRMVEEHSANLTSRIDPEYSSSVGVALPNPVYQVNDTKLLDQTNTASSNYRQSETTNLATKTVLNNSNTGDKGASCDLDVKCTTQEGSKDNSSKSFRPNTIETNPKSLDEDTCKIVTPNSTKTEDQNNSSDEKVDMTVEDNNISPSANECNPTSTQNIEKSESPKPGCSNQQDNGESSSAHSSDGARDELSILLPSPSGYPKTHSLIRKLRLENERLQAEITRLRRLVVSGASALLAERKTPTETSSEAGKIYSLEMELVLAREALLTLKSDRRRLKAEKFDLLNQMKQLYATLEDKEKELRDFIRNYEQRVRENETSLQQLSTEREERERERWSLLRHARDEAERSLSLAAQLNAKELQLQQAQEQLQDARRQLASSASVCLSDQESIPSLPRHSINGGALTPGSGGLLSGHHGLGHLPGDRGSCSADSGVRVSSDRESGATSVAGNLSDSTTDGTPTITVEGGNVDMDSVSLVSSIPPPHMYQSVSAPKDCSPTLSPLNANAFIRSIDTNALSRSVEQLSSPLDPEPIIGRRNKTSHSRPTSGRGGTWGSISRVFARSRHRNKSNSLQESNDSSYEPYRSWSPLTEEGYAEKLRLLREASSVPMERWRAPTVLAWLEVALGMPQYGARCAENVKSGKIGPLHGQVLLELSDLELECGLGITHAMHRKKLRLAIEEHRHPALIRYPCIAQLGHTWVASEWLPDIGLAQYSDNFTSNMVDARMLEHLSKKELEKYLGVTRKFHQASVVHGIHLLRIMKYDRQALAVRRHQCENVDADPLVWTNQRFIRWARNIDLGEYADNLKDSGVHGGLVVLEPSFNSDTMATALGIPTSKNIIRRHLTAELESLILPARSTLEHYVRVRTKSRVQEGSLGRSFSRSYAGLTGLLTDKNDMKTRRESLRESLNKAKGFFERNAEKQSPTSSSETSSVISHISSPLQIYRTSHSGGESPIYAIPFAHQKPCSVLNKRAESEEYEFSITEQGGTKCSVSNYISTNENRKSSSSIIGGSLHRNRKHRRVRSIGNIDLIKTEAI